MNRVGRSGRLNIAIIALLISMAFIATCSLLPLPGTLKKLLFDQGQNPLFTYPFTIQNLIWCTFFVGLGELYHRARHIKAYYAALRSHYLPEEDSIVLTQRDMGALYREVKPLSNELAGLIKSLVLRFQAGRSVEQTHQMLNSQLEIWQYRLDIDYSMIRYLTWLIPTLGFIGTVLGIARTLSYAGSSDAHPASAHFLSELTGRLGVAFDTTLLALVMSALLVFAMHIIHSREERAIIQSGQYCLNNLITRLYVE